VLALLHGYRWRRLEAGTTRPGPDRCTGVCSFCTPRAAGPRHVGPRRPGCSVFEHPAGWWTVAPRAAGRSCSCRRRPALRPPGCRLPP